MIRWLAAGLAVVLLTSVAFADDAGTPGGADAVAGPAAAAVEEPTPGQAAAPAEQKKDGGTKGKKARKPKAAGTDATGGSTTGKVAQKPGKGTKAGKGKDAASSPPVAAATSSPDAKDASGGTGVWVAIGMAVLGLIVLGSGLSGRCPKCGKWWARQRTGSELANQAGGFKTVTVIDKGVTSKGEILAIERKEQRHFTQDTYHHFFKCGKCGYAWYTEEVKAPVEG